VSSKYAGASKELVRFLKFQRIKVSANIIANWLDDSLPPLHESTIVTAIPTANKRVRLRGYDQAQLIAKHFAKKRRLRRMNLLSRVTTTRQVGASRTERFVQLENAFRLQKNHKLAGQRILLVDDVLTTGATLESAAKILKESGVTTIEAAIFAH
jgi:ComF family protein